jgi:hypothetical protein
MKVIHKNTSVRLPVKCDAILEVAEKISHIPERILIDSCVDAAMMRLAPPEVKKLAEAYARYLCKDLIAAIATSQDGVETGDLPRATRFRPDVEYALARLREMGVTSGFTVGQCIENEIVGVVTRILTGRMLTCDPQTIERFARAMEAERRKPRRSRTMEIPMYVDGSAWDSALAYYGKHVTERLDHRTRKKVARGRRQNRKVANG